MVQSDNHPSGVDYADLGKTIFNPGRGLGVECRDATRWLGIEYIESEGAMREFIPVIAREDDQLSIGRGAEVKRTDPPGAAHQCLSSKLVSFAFNLAADRHG